MKTWHNGQPCDDPWARSRALHYGDGVFRTCLKYDGQLVDLERQLSKLRADALRLELDAPAAEVLAEDLRQASAAEATAVVKLLLVRSGTQRGYRSRSADCERLVTVSPLPRYPASHWREGVRVFRCQFTLGIQPALAGIKHLNRLEQVMAAREWVEGMDEGILGDMEGHPICGTRSNLFWVRNGRLHTALLDRCGVAGVMRQRILETAAQLGITPVEDRASWDEVAGAEEVFLSNSLIGIWPVREWEGRPRPAPGPTTTILMDALGHPRLY